MGKTKPGKQYFTGARALFYYSSQLIGYARGVSGTEEYTMEPINVLGTLETVDYVPTSYRVTFRCRFFRLLNPDGQPELKGDIFPKTVDDIFNKLTDKNFEAHIVDAIDGKTILRLTNVVPVSRSFDVDSRGVWGEDVTFNAIYAGEEESPSK
jgi:hypothetical protein